jgi:hypothetical protein
LQRCDDSRDELIERQTSSAAPRVMSSRFTARAKALSFIFFFTAATSTSAMLFDGRTRATAVTNPLSSSTA